MAARVFIPQNSARYNDQSTTACSAHKLYIPILRYKARQGKEPI